MKLNYAAANFSDLAQTDLGKRIWKYLISDHIVISLLSTAKLRRPAVEVLAVEIPIEFPELNQLEVNQRDRVKQMIGHMIRQVMEHHGYKLDQQRVKVTRGNLFATGSRYSEPASTNHDE